MAICCAVLLIECYLFEKFKLRRKRKSENEEEEYEGKKIGVSFWSKLLLFLYFFTSINNNINLKVMLERGSKNAKC